jgi:PUB domain
LCARETSQRKIHLRAESVFLMDSRLLGSRMPTTEEVLEHVALEKAHKKLVKILFSEVLDFKHIHMDTVESCLCLLQKMFVNVLEHPQEDKFRHVSTDPAASGLRTVVAKGVLLEFSALFVGQNQQQRFSHQSGQRSACGRILVCGRVEGQGKLASVELKLVFASILSCTEEQRYQGLECSALNGPSCPIARKKMSDCLSAHLSLPLCGYTTVCQFC